MLWFSFLNSAKLFIILLVLSSVCGFYYSPIREFRSFASARINRLLSPQRRSAAPFCGHPCHGLSGECSWFSDEFRKLSSLRSFLERSSFEELLWESFNAICSKELLRKNFFNPKTDLILILIHLILSP